MGYPETMRDIMEEVRREEIRKKRKELNSHPIIDDETGFYNKKFFYLRLDEEIARAKLYGKDLSLIMLELGNFKEIDGTTKTPDGYNVLKCTADIINSCVRYEIDLPFRYSENKFAIILPEINSPQACDVAQNIQKMIRIQKMKNITMHAGIVQCDYHEQADEFVKSANDTLSKDKQRSNGN